MKKVGMGESEVTVSLRAVERADLLIMAEAAADPGRVGEHNFAGEPDSEKILQRLQKRFDSDGMLGTSSGQLVVTLGNTFVGDLSWRLERWGPSIKSACPAIGISLLPEFRGRGIGSIAQRLFAAHLFRQTPTNRVQADTALDNIAEQRALEKAGFVQEGIVRGCEWRNDRWHDHILYGITRKEWEATSFDA